MRISFGMALFACGFASACMIEPITFTPLADDTAEGCGDGTRQDPEVCDGMDLAGEDCSTVGDFPDGTLACNASCTDFDTSACGTTPTVPQLRLPMNDAYVGHIALAGSRRPTFTWEPSSAGTGATITYELQFSLDPAFATDVTTVPTAMTSYRPAADLDVSTTAPVGARYYWRVRACAVALCSASSSAWRVNLGRSDRDFNGDGFADLIVGAHLAAAQAGRAYVYFGGPSVPFNTTADGTLAGAAADDFFGCAVASAGDVNGDGFADVVVGARSANAVVGADAGRAYIYLGGPGATFDATADGTLTGAVANHNFGYAVASAGDVNSDGFADVVVGGNGSARRADIYFGGTGATFEPNADATLISTVSSDAFGSSVASAGDVNGDGLADVVVGAHYNNPAGTSAGSAYVYFGTAGATFDATADGTLTDNGVGNSFGFSVASAGDVNADGFSDVVIGVNVGIAHVYLGGAGESLDATADSTLTVNSGDLGICVASAGDVNRDGFGDVIIGVELSDKAEIFYGVPGGLEATSDGTLTSAAPNIFFGGSVASAGDVNGDGFADVVIGAYASDQFTGRAYIYLGSSTSTFDAVPDGNFTGAAQGDRFGISVN